MIGKNATRSIAVVGFGPRGLGAVEALAKRAFGCSTTLTIDLFDPITCPGAGPNFHTEENPLCQLNIPMRDIEIQPQSHPGLGDIGSFHCLDLHSGPDDFPPRAALGNYLVKRFESLEQNAPGKLPFSVHQEKVIQVERNNDGWLLKTSHRCFGPYDEVLLTQGQPEAAPDEQLSRWQAHAASCGADLLPAYPTNSLLMTSQRWKNRPVAIRGLGLSTIDVVRLLTIGMGGQFENGKYIRSGREPALLLPFSLDGHPPIPKPSDTSLDARFDPLPQESRNFRDGLRSAMTKPPEQALQGICQALLAPSIRIMKSFGSAASEGEISEWLTVERSQADKQETMSTVDSLRLGIAMANGRLSPSPGFAVGQLWRKWQGALRSEFHISSTNPATAKAIIGFDEGLKRYSYGPPIASAEQLLVLIEEGLVDPRVAADPDVILVDDGWQLVTDDSATRASALVDAVLPSQALEHIVDPVVSSLRAEGRMCSVADGLGAHTCSDGQLIGSDKTIQRGLSLLGRLALGSVIAVDSIHDCFGSSAENWADGVLSRVR